MDKFQRLKNIFKKRVATNSRNKFVTKSLARLLNTRLKKNSYIKGPKVIEIKASGNSAFPAADGSKLIKLEFAKQGNGILEQKGIRLVASNSTTIGNYNNGYVDAFIGGTNAISMDNLFAALQILFTDVSDITLNHVSNSSVVTITISKDIYIINAELPVTDRIELTVSNP
ncbi:MAG: hypothetical protein SNJ71_05580 [Bacteroidales bacterium]